MGANWYKNPAVIVPVLAIAAIVAMVVTNRGPESKKAAPGVPRKAAVPREAAVKPVSAPKPEAPAAKAPAPAPAPGAPRPRARLLTELAEGQYGYSPAKAVAAGVKAKLPQQIRVYPAQASDYFEVRVAGGEAQLIGFLFESPEGPKPGADLNLVHRRMKNAGTPVGVPLSAIREIQAGQFPTGNMYGLVIKADKVTTEVSPHEP